MAKKIPPSKVIMTMGEKITQSQFSGKVSGANLINAVIHLMKDIEKTTGMNPKGSLAIVAEFFGYRIIPIERNPTMSASLSEKTAKEEE